MGSYFVGGIVRMNNWFWRNRWS